MTRTRWCREHLTEIVEHCEIGERTVQRIEQVSDFEAEHPELGELATDTILTIIRIKDPEIRDTALAEIPGLMKNDEKVTAHQIKQIVEREHYARGLIPEAGVGRMIVEARDAARAAGRFVLPPKDPDFDEKAGFAGWPGKRPHQVVGAGKDGDKFVAELIARETDYHRKRELKSLMEGEDSDKFVAEARKALKAPEMEGKEPTPVDTKSDEEEAGPCPGSREEYVLSHSRSGKPVWKKKPVPETVPPTNREAAPLSLSRGLPGTPGAKVITAPQEPQPAPSPQGGSTAADAAEVLRVRSTNIQVSTEDTVILAWLVETGRVKDGLAAAQLAFDTGIDRLHDFMEEKENQGQDPTSEV